MTRRAASSFGPLALTALASFVLAVSVLSCSTPPERSAESVLLPRAASVAPGAEGSFDPVKPVRLECDAGDREQERLARWFAEHAGWTVHPSAQAVVRLSIGTSSAPLSGAASTQGSAPIAPVYGEPEYGAYRLEVKPEEISVSAPSHEGLWNALQTLAQLAVHAGSARGGIPVCVIEDAPRFVWRGAMLDVARHFFTVDEVKRFIDLASAHKLNRLHLHLSDDQGFRLEIPSLPELTEVGSISAVGGDPGGFYTTKDWCELQDYAKSRYVTIVPEIDLPGHTNAILASFPELNASGRAAEPYYGMQVGFSKLDLSLPATKPFLEELIGSLAAMTDGEWIHIGGDEANSMSDAEYRAFLEYLLPLARSTGKKIVGWADIAAGPLEEGDFAQAWQPRDPRPALKAAEKGADLILSPADLAYLDMMYDEDCMVGQNWAGFTDLEEAAMWRPERWADGLDTSRIAGIEACLWTETIMTMEEVEFMAYPRLSAIAELAWAGIPSGWDELRERMALHGVYLERLGVNYARADGVDWKAE